METSPYRPTPEEAKPQGDPRIDAAMQLLEAGIDRIHDSEEFKRYLEFSSKFHKYSPRNSLLIWMQKPDATDVMGYGSRDGRTGWKSVGRQVRAGEKAIKIFAPLLKKEVDIQTGEQVEVLRGYKLVNVFDVSQTDGDELPKRPSPREIESSTEAGHRMFTANWDWLATKGVPVFRREVPGIPGARGSFSPGREGSGAKIYVRSDMAIDMQAKTLAHESAHMVADHRWHMPKEEVELEAEAAAFVTSYHFGVDTSSYSFDYITHWSHDRDLFKQKLTTIQQLSKTLIDGIGQHYPDALSAPPEFDSSPVYLSEGLPHRLPSRDELGGGTA